MKAVIILDEKKIFCFLEEEKPFDNKRERERKTDK